MKVVSTGRRYKCPECGTVVELEKKDIKRWNSILYYKCPTCRATPHIQHSRFDNWCCPYDIAGKLAKEV